MLPGALCWGSLRKPWNRLMLGHLSAVWASVRSAAQPCGVNTEVSSDAGRWLGKCSGLWCFHRTHIDVNDSKMTDFQSWRLALLILLLRRWVQEFSVILDYIGSSGLTWAT